MNARFAEVWLLGDDLPALPSQLAECESRREVPPGLLDQQGRLLVRETISFFDRSKTTSGYTLVLTNRDLSLPECRSLFGFADRKSGIAVVSTARIDNPTNSSALTTRLLIEIEHEWGHLWGLGHCNTPGCVMSRAQSAHELDSRGKEFCGRCPPLWQALLSNVYRLAAIAVLAGLVAGIGTLAGLLVNPFGEIPFT